MDRVNRTALVLFLANAAVIASWLILHAIWFDGAISCDEVATASYDQCSDRADLLVALVEDEATVKRFFREPDHVRLQPENKTMKPIIARDVSILGRVVGVFRKVV